MCGYTQTQGFSSTQFRVGFWILTNSTQMLWMWTEHIQYTLNQGSAILSESVRNRNSKGPGIGIGITLGDRSLAFLWLFRENADFSGFLCYAPRCVPKYDFSPMAKIRISTHICSFSKANDSFVQDFYDLIIDFESFIKHANNLEIRAKNTKIFGSAWNFRLFCFSLIPFLKKI